MARRTSRQKKKPAKFRFSKGTLMLDDGSLDEPEIALELLSSNGVTVYTAIRWKISQLASCNCPGWANNRECKHSREALSANRSSYKNRETTLLRAVKEDSVDIGGRRSRQLQFDDSSG